MGSNLPSTGITAMLQEQLADNQVSPTQAGGTPFLKFDAKRTGEWLFGASGEPVTEDVFSLDLESLQHGYIQWHAKKVNRRMAPINKPLPTPQDPIHYKDSRGRDQTDEANEGRALEGTFADGSRFVFETNSFGGRKAVDKVLGELFTRAAERSPFLWPHVRLDSNSYEHAEYGEVFEPVLTVVEWYDEEGNAEGGTKRVAQDKPAEDPVKQKRQRKPAKQEEVPDEEEQDASSDADDGSDEAPAQDPVKAPAQEEAPAAGRRRRRARS